MRGMGESMRGIYMLLHTEAVASRLRCGLGLLPLPCRLEDAVVDEVCPLVARYRLDDGDDFVCGVEEACLGVLLLPARAITCAAPLVLFPVVFFHGRIIICIFASKTRMWEGFPSLGCQIQTLSLILIFQILKKIEASIGHSGFRFPYSFQGFRVPLLSLIDNTKVRKFLNLPNIFKIICALFAKFLRGGQCRIRVALRAEIFQNRIKN